MNPLDGAGRAHTLLLEIAGCRDAPAARADRRHPCGRIVHTQPTFPGSFQVPEPWAGHLHEAPLLFIGSNPSIDRREPYPEWTDDQRSTLEFFDNRFGGGVGQVKDGVYFPLRVESETDPHHSPRQVPFWASCKRNAAWLFGRPVRPGIDYAMTEVVHCKSRSEIGVRDARAHCAQRWLEPVLQASPARVIVLLGQHAELAFAPVTGPLEYWAVRHVSLAGQERAVLVARHPNYRGRRKWQDHIPENTRASLQRLLTTPEQEAVANERP